MNCTILSWWSAAFVPLLNVQPYAASAIPFDKGWTLLANGQPVALEPVFQGLLGAVLPPGNYAIRLRYQDPYLRWGMLVSAASLVLLLVVSCCTWWARGTHPVSVAA